MSFVDVLEQNNAAAMALAGAIETAMGGDIILGVSRPKRVAPSTDNFPSGPLRVATCELTSGFEGAVHIVMSESIAQTLERLAPDELMLTSLTPVFEAGTAALRGTAPVPIAFGAVEESTADDVINGSGDVEFLLHTLIDGQDIVATIVFAMGDAVIDATGGAPGTGMQSTGNAGPSVSAHQFQQLQDSAISLVDPRSMALLHDVEMGVTAELGRRRMTVRDLLSLTPGAVIELDRAAGSPVDVLVNGTLIARGEVVVIDEEFGIRISEIVATAEMAV
jgi:flagellar motor switch protein FliN/FliY